MLAAHSWAALANAPVGIVASIKAAKAHSASGTAAAPPKSVMNSRRLIPMPPSSWGHRNASGREAERGSSM